MILTESLSKSYRQAQVIKTVNLQVPEGSIYGFLGPNGSGKSTTLRLLLGLESPSSGRILLNGFDLTSHRQQALKNVGAIIEQPALYPNLTAFENLQITCQLLNLPLSRIPEALQKVDLTDTGKKQVRDFSMGMKQRLGIANALLQHPRLLILDEPTNGLDPVANLRLKQILQDLHQDGVTLLVTSHILADMEALCTHVGFIYQGTLTHQGSMQDLMARHQSTARIRTSDNPRAAELLGGWVTEAGEDHLILSTMNDPELARVNRTLVDHGLDVFQLQLQKPSLEDIFHRLIQSEGHP